MNIRYDNISIKDKIYIYAGSIDISSTGLFLIQGDNGVGKSLLLKNIHDKLNSLTRTVFVDQNNYAVLSYLSTVDNITMLNKDFEENAKRILLLFDSYDIIDCPVKYLSGGQKRILSLTRALVSNSRVLLIDEPTNDLDYDKVVVLKQLLKDCSRNRLVIIISHDDRLVDIANNIFNVQNGKLIAVSPTKISQDNSLNKGTIWQEELKIIMEKSRFSYYYSKFFVFLLLSLNIIFVFFSNRCFHGFQSFKVTTPKLLYDNQVDIYREDSVLGIGLNTVGSIQLSQLISSDTYKNTQNNTSIILDSDELMDVYAVEYFDPNTNSNYYTLDVYLEKLLHLDIDNYWIDTSHYFLMDSQYNDGKPIVMEESIFRDAEKYIETNFPHSYPIYVCLRLKNGNTLTDVIDSKEFHSIAGNFIYIYSNETIDIFENLRKIKNEKANTSLYFKEFLICLIVEVLLIFSFLALNRNDILLFKNYGFTCRNVKTALLGYSIRLVVLFYLISLLSFFVYEKYIYKQTMVGSVVVFIGMLIYYISSILLCRLLVHIGVKREYDWRYR